MKGFWFFDTKWGRFSIVPVGSRFNLLFGEENLGTYHSVTAAIDDLSSGHTYPLPRNLRSSKMGLPTELSGWSFASPE